MDLYVYKRSAQKSIIGFAVAGEGVVAGQVPVALIIAHALEAESAPANALVAVPVPADPNAYIYVAIREGFILADGDEIGPEDAMQTRLKGMLSVASWDLVIAPPHWRINNAVERNLESFLPRKKDKLKIPDTWKLRPTRLAWQKAAAQMVVVLMILGASVYGFRTWQQNEDAKRALQAELQRQAEAERLRIASEQMEPWPNIPRALSYAIACEQAVNKTGIITANWSFAGLVCEGQQLTMRWERATTSAWISHFKQLRPNAVISADGVFASVVVPLDLKAAGKDSGESPPSLQSRTEYLRDVPSSYGMAIAITGGTPAQPAGPPGSAPAPPQPRWTEIGISASTSLSMIHATQVLDAPAFRLSRIEGETKGGLFKVRLIGIQYAKP